MEESVHIPKASENPFIQSLGFTSTNVAWDEPSARGKILIAAGFRLTIPQRLIFQSNCRKFRNLFEADDDVSKIGDRRMSVIKIKLLPEFFRRVSVHPANALLNGVGRSAVPCQRIGGLFRGHRGQGQNPTA